MALIIKDPNSSGPFAGFQTKDLRCKVFDVPFTAFTTSGADTLLGAIPATASIVSIKFWVKTALAGNGVTSPTAKVGSTSGGTDLVTSAQAITNTQYTISNITASTTGFYALWNPPYTTGDIQIWLHGACSTGNPTSGEMYCQVDYFT